MALILAGVLGVFLCLIGVALIWSPFTAVQAFGIDPSHLADIALAPGLGVRDIALGLTHPRLRRWLANPWRRAQRCSLTAHRARLAISPSRARPSDMPPPPGI